MQAEVDNTDTIVVPTRGEVGSQNAGCENSKNTKRNRKKNKRHRTKHRNGKSTKLYRNRRARLRNSFGN